MSDRERPRRVVLVTGAARRIGCAIARACAARGLDVAVHHATSGAAAEALVDELRALGVASHAFCADLTADGAARALADAVLARFGRVDVLVHNASVFERTPLLATSPTAWTAAVRRAFALHPAAALELVHALAPGMVERGGGAVVFLGDADRRRIAHAPYAASKAALEALVPVLARELAPHVRVNAVAPGSILPAAGGAAPDALVRAVPAGRLGTPAEVADAVLFLALGPAFVTGQVLGIDGAQHV